MSLFDELKRRNVFRVGVAYAVIGWVVLQVASTLAPALSLPEWTLPMLVFVGACGFPFALLFAWAFELTPEGIKRTADVVPGESVTRETGGKLNRVIIGLLSLALVMVVLERFMLSERTVGPGETTIEKTLGPTSIAVLPFVNMSEDKANEHFGDGLAEELLNLLAQVPDLHVAARTSSFYFRGKDVTIAEVAEALQVGTVLEGSVQRAGDTIRVTAQLITAEDGSHLWSQKYDRPFKDIFKVQDDIATQIVAALMPHLNVQEYMPASTDTGDISPDLYERFLLARHVYYERTQDSSDRAHQEFMAITQAAPDYGPAWSWLALSWLRVSGPALELAYTKTESAIEKALELNPEDPNAYRALTNLWLSKGDYDKALGYANRALELDPRSVDAMMDRQYALVYLGRPQAAIESLQEARRLDPLHPDMLNQLAHLLNLQGDRQGAFEVLESLRRVSPGRAARAEFHLYGDDEQLARLVYFAELDRASAEPAIPTSRFARSLSALGLYDHPLLMEGRLRAVALAANGDIDAARAARAEALVEIEDPDERLFLKMMTYNALGEYQQLSDLLWERWLRWSVSGSDNFSDEFWEYHAMLLGIAAFNTGEQQRLDVVLPALAAGLATWSSDHQASFDAWMARLALLQGDEGKALALYSRMVERGVGGEFSQGRSVLASFKLEDDERFESIREGFAANRRAELVELQRLRDSGMTAAQMRREYLAE